MVKTDPTGIGPVAVGPATIDPVAMNVPGVAGVLAMVAPAAPSTIAAGGGVGVGVGVGVAVGAGTGAALEAGGQSAEAAWADWLGAIAPAPTRRSPTRTRVVVCRPVSRL